MVCIEQPQLFRLAKLLIAGHRRRPDPMLVASNSVGLPLRIIAAAFSFKPAFHRIEDVVRLVLKQPDIVEVIEKANGLNAPLAPDLPAGDERFNFRPLTEEEKKDFMDSLDAKGRQMFADLESPPKAVRARRKIRGPKVEIEHNVTHVTSSQ